MESNKVWDEFMSCLVDDEMCEQVYSKEEAMACHPVDALSNQGVGQSSVGPVDQVVIQIEPVVEEDSAGEDVVFVDELTNKDLVAHFANLEPSLASYAFEKEVGFIQQEGGKPFHDQRHVEVHRVPESVGGREEVSPAADSVETDEDAALECGLSCVEEEKGFTLQDCDAYMESDKVWDEFMSCLVDDEMCEQVYSKEEAMACHPVDALSNQGLGNPLSDLKIRLVAHRWCKVEHECSTKGLGKDDKFKAAFTKCIRELHSPMINQLMNIYARSEHVRVMQASVNKVKMELKKSPFENVMSYELQESNCKVGGSSVEGYYQRLARSNFEVINGARPVAEQDSEEDVVLPSSIEDFSEESVGGREEVSPAANFVETDEDAALECGRSCVEEEKEFPLQDCDAYMESDKVWDEFMSYLADDEICEQVYSKEDAMACGGCRFLLLVRGLVPYDPVGRCSKLWERSKCPSDPGGSL
ncbi:hypothetical protein L7F22_063630 [Adiantum nelumboides]|nr:hypothetical protein [Adiantum nelumboides]